MSGSGLTNSETYPGYIINQDDPQPSGPQARAFARARADVPFQFRLHPPSRLQQHGQQPQQQQQQHFNNNPVNPINPIDPVASFDSSANAYRRATAPAVPETRSTFTLDAVHPYAAIPSAPLVNQGIGATTGATGGTDLSHRLNWGSALGHLSQEKAERIEAPRKVPHEAPHEAPQGLTTCLASDPSVPSDMRYLSGPLDVLSAEQYDDGRYLNNHRLAKHDVHLLTKAGSAPNPKKRGRKPSQNDQTAPAVEETKRARGRPRLETGSHQDMKERRKEQIRLAQRAYRNRKETAISVLENRVAELEASKDMICQEFKTLILEYTSKHALDARMPELGRRLQQFQDVLSKLPESTSPGSEERPSEVKPRDPLETEVMALEGKSAGRSTASTAVSSPPVPQSEPLYGGIIVTHEPEPESMVHESAALQPPLENEDYTVVRFPSENNSSIRFNIDFLDSPAPDEWPLNLHSLSAPSSGAYLENTWARKLHRRATENAARLLAQKKVPDELMRRAFGFVLNYATLDEIRQRISNTLARKADEDLNMYTQPFHNMGGSGTHYFDGNKPIPYSGGAPFPSTGFGMGPFNERTTRVRDDLLDMLQHTNFPGWQGEWLDSYDVQRLLTQRLVALPPSGEGFVDIPPGEFYYNPLEKEASSAGTNNLQIAFPGKDASDFNTSPSPSNMASVPAADDGRYPLALSTMDTMLSIPATVNMWASSTTATVDFPGSAQTQSTSIPPAMSFDSSLAFSNPSHFVYPSSTLHFNAGHLPPKRVWFSMNKFIESLGNKGTCAGRGPAFRKRDVVLAFWEAVSLDAE